MPLRLTMPSQYSPRISMLLTLVFPPQFVAAPHAKGNGARKHMLSMPSTLLKPPSASLSGHIPQLLIPNIVYSSLWGGGPREARSSLARGQ
ncbi:hypothetical protein F4823DRAFT_575072 [Ustulina deusta]|nr:hypothetical protein F4823DRAFT_575072 [Ustulina deusta]